MVIILWIVLAAVPFLLGTGMCRILYGREYEKSCGKSECFVHGIIGVIGVAEVAYIPAVFLHWTVDRMAAVLGIGVAVLCAASLIWFVFEKRRNAKIPRLAVAEPVIGASQMLTGGLLLSVILQVVIIMAGEGIYRDGDMTLETVQTFLADNGIYRSNPLTGQPYVGGIPLRLKILCLPGLYASVCSLTGIDAGQFVGGMWPIVVLAGSYMAYLSLGKCLFAKDRAARLFLLVLVSVLFWLGDYMVTMDGFQLLHCGYRGTALRNGILVPFTLSMSLQKKWKSAVLAILAELCIVWTLYGLGVCFLVTVLMVVIRFADSRREGRKCRNS